MGCEHETEPFLDHDVRSAEPTDSGRTFDNKSSLPKPMDISRHQRTLILCGLWSATFLSALNFTLVATLVSSITSEFKSANEASWLGTSFLLATCTFTPLYGRLCNAAGRRAAIQAAILFCGVGTLTCGLSTSMYMLIIARFVAGLGGGGIYTTSTICVADLYSLRDRSLTQGYSSILTGLGLGLGGPLGGYISDRFGWRWAFLAQIPIFVVSFTLVTLHLNYPTPGRSKSSWEVIKRIDYLGCATLLFAVASYIVFLSLRYNEDLSWSNKGVIASIVLTFVLFIVFILVELLVAAEPVLAPALLSQRVPVLVGLSNLTVSIVNFSVTYYLPMWFEMVDSASVTVAGMHIMPNSVSMSLGSLFSGYMMHKTGKYKKLTIIFSLFPIGAALALARLKSDSWAITQWLSIVPLGFGNAVVLQTTLTALLASIPQSMLAVGTGFTQLFRGIGQVSGIAVTSAIFQTVLEQELKNKITGPGSEMLISNIRHSSRVVLTLPAEKQVLARDAYSIALNRVFLFTAVVGFIGFCIRLGIPELSLDQLQEDPRATIPLTTPTKHDEEAGSLGEDSMEFSEDEDAMLLGTPTNADHAGQGDEPNNINGYDPEIVGSPYNRAQSLELFNGGLCLEPPFHRQPSSPTHK